ncbi:MAG TPA: GNAT family protein [Vicinamibacterales bacterium]|nr:GNAT family protein [Vicinamibacterales bacterium]
MELPLTRCAIRSWHPADAHALARHANSRAVWRNLRDRFPHPYTLADAEAWIARARAARPETHFAIAVGGEAVGGIGLELQIDVARRSAEIGYWLGEAYWGRGIATEAVRALTEHAFAAFDLCRIYAFVFEWNPASARVLEKAGFIREARLRKAVTKDGRTIDAFLYALVR